MKRYVGAYGRDELSRTEYGHLGKNRGYVIHGDACSKFVCILDTVTWNGIAVMFFDIFYATSMLINVVISGGYIIVICEKAGSSGSAVDIRFYNMSGTLRKWYTCNVSGDVDIKVYPGRAKVAIISYEWNTEWTRLTHDARHVTVRTVELVAINRHHTYG